MKMQQPKKPETRTKVDFLFERATFCQKSQLVKLAQKLRKSQPLETNPDSKLVKISHILRQKWDHQSYITYLTKCRQENTKLSKTITLSKISEILMIISKLTKIFSSF